MPLFFMRKSMQNNTELLCLILEFQSRSLIVQGLLQAEAAKEYKADWLKNADTVVRDRGGKFAKKGTSIAQPIQDATAILKQGFDLMGDTIQSLVKDPEFRKRAGLAAGLPMAKLISNLATQARLNPKLTEKLDEWIANATKEFADQYGDDKSPMAQAIRNNKLAQPPKDASFNEKMEFRVAQYAAYKEALDSPEDFSKRDELISKAATAAIPIGVSLAIALGFEVAIPLFLAQSVNWATVLSSVAIGEAADFAVQKGMDKLEINNPALRIGASMVAGILAGGLVTGVNNKIKNIERLEVERLANEEAKRLADEETERLAKEEIERLAKEKAKQLAEETERLAKEKAKKLAEEAERLAKEKAKQLAEEAERLAKEKAKQLAEEAERLAKEKAKQLAEEAERLAKEKAKQLAEEAERLAKEKAKQLADHRRALARQKEEADRRANEITKRLANEVSDRQAIKEAMQLVNAETDPQAKEDARQLVRSLEKNAIASIIGMPWQYIDNIIESIDKKGYTKGMGVRHPQFPLQGDCTLYEITKQRGFHNLPKEVSEEEINKLISSGSHVDSYRGVLSDDKSGVDHTKMVQDFKYGEFFQGKGIYGQGMYVATTPPAPGISIYDSSEARKVALKYATDRGRSSIRLQGSLMRMVIPKNMKEITYDEMSMFLDKIKNIGKENITKISSDEDTNKDWLVKRILKDPGYVAALMGYDAIRVEYDGSIEMGINYLVILNRGIVTIQDKVETVL